jgi:hypothetical protein
VEAESSLQCSQDPAIGPHREPYEYNQNPPHNSDFLKTNSNINRPSATKSTKLSLSQSLYEFLDAHHLFTLTIGMMVKSRKLLSSSSLSCSPASCYSLFLFSLNILFSTLFSSIFQSIFFLLRARGQISHPFKTTGKTVLYTYISTITFLKGDGRTKILNWMVASIHKI